ncbi:MAG: LysM peptidoglycan-binding domain-containing protein, partial [Caldilinea sp.]
MTTRNGLAQTGDSHVVAPGETLTEIARRYQTDVSTLMRLNALSDPSLIRSGQRLIVPSDVVGSGAGRSSEAGSALETTPTEGFIDTATRIYIVHPGDTLASIAAKLQTTAARLAEMNQRSPSMVLHVGEALRAPVAEGIDFAPQAGNDIPVPGKYYVHVVQEGETLSAIAAAYGTSLR